MKILYEGVVFMIFFMLVIHLFSAWILFSTVHLCFWDVKARKAPMTINDLIFLIVLLVSYAGTGIYLFD